MRSLQQINHLARNVSARTFHAVELLSARKILSSHKKVSLFGLLIACKKQRGKNNFGEKIVLLLYIMLARKNCSSRSRFREK